MISVRRLRVTVPANSFQVTHAKGDFLLVESCEDNTAILAKAIGLKGGTVLEDAIIRTSATYRKLPDYYERLVFTNSSASDVDIVIWTGEGDVDLNISADDVATELANVAIDSDDETPAAGVTENFEWEDISPVMEIHVENDDGSANAVRVGLSSGLADNKGKKVHPGETYVLKVNPMALGLPYGYRNPTGGGAVTVRYKIIGRSAPGTSSP